MTDPPPERESITSTPRWVKVFGIITLILILVFIILHLAGGGMGNHTPPIEHKMEQP
jgi:hypothetical protein